MSKLNKIFNSIPVQIPDRSGFDLSHESIGTASTGTVVPVTHFEVLPGDKISMGSAMKVTLPPFAVPFNGRIDAELTAAFIPYRLIWNGWQSFITQNPGYQESAAAEHSNVPLTVPTLATSADPNYFPDELTMYNRGTLADYLGVKPFITRDAQGGQIINWPNLGTKRISALPFLAYQKFCDDWIRDDNNMKPFFPDKIASESLWREANDPSAGGLINAGSRFLSGSGRLLPRFAYQNSDPGSLYLSPYRPASASQNVNGAPVDISLGLGSLRQRCWAKDYFTTATHRPQAGAASSVVFDTSGNTGAFTIASLRAANSLQKWMERNNIAGTDYGSQILAHFGVMPPDAVMNRSLLLGSVRCPVLVNGVENNSNADTAEGTKNPFGSALGSAAGFGSASDSGRLINDFEAKEHGVIMVFFTLIPHAYYNSGINRSLFHTAYGDFGWPEFAGIGDQEIFATELTSQSTPDNVFGYNQRYSEYKMMLDRISGLVQDGDSLDVYALQRGFGVGTSLGSEFLEIPKDYLDQVFAVTEAISGFSCIFDCFFDCSALRVLPEYSLPKL